MRARGFSLIEAVCIIVIIALLSSIGVVAYTEVKVNAQDDITKASLAKLLRSAQASYTTKRTKVDAWDQAVAATALEANRGNVGSTMWTTKSPSALPASLGEIVFSYSDRFIGLSILSPSGKVCTTVGTFDGVVMPPICPEGRPHGLSNYFFEAETISPPPVPTTPPTLPPTSPPTTSPPTSPVTSPPPTTPPGVCAPSNPKPLLTLDVAATLNIPSLLSALPALLGSVSSDVALSAASTTTGDFSGGRLGNGDFVAAYSESTPKWRVSVPYGAGSGVRTLSASPDLLFATGSATVGTTVYPKGSYITALDQQNGATAWTYLLDVNGGVDVVSSSFANNTLYILGSTSGSLKTPSSLPTAPSYFVAALSTTGQLLWTKEYPLLAGESVSDIAATQEGIFLASTTTTSAGTVNTDALLTRLNLDGSLVWAKNFGSCGNDKGLSLSVAAGVVLLGGELTGNLDGALGYQSTPSASNPDAFIAAFNLDGTALWARDLGTDKVDTVYDVAASSEAVFVGYRSPVYNLLSLSFLESSRVVALQLDTGAVVKVQNGVSLLSPGSVEAYAHVLTPEGHLLQVGATSSFFSLLSPNKGSLDAFLRRL